ncbi:hypothetical protein AAW14_00090 [Streptomyces hygroscopicus]|uniref:pentapeptide repeat-containing protein n=1 Tax=Streptomyces hygroscopicus TaxID=1912 RepID=UPI0022409129|nr:pentapeptide repeat-containing protein [Streptomyces hygroscopicus]MCW7940517.1 hypothetical protein [Streptomyces hygroscopicus]
MSTPVSPSWPHCGLDAAPATDPVGCRGIRVSGRTACLAHLTDTDLNAYLISLTPGTDIDHRGTPFTQALLDALLDALRDPTTHTARFKSARFDGAQFSGASRFDGAQFSGAASFRGAQFSGTAWFSRVQFSGLAGFDKARFSGDATFSGARFSGGARFVEAQFDDDARFFGAEFTDDARFVKAHFSRDAHFAVTCFSSEAWFMAAQFVGDAQFDRVQFDRTARFSNTKFCSDALFIGTKFTGLARFGKAHFAGDAHFNGTQFAHDAQFDGVRFEGTPVLGPLVCAGRFNLSRTVFAVPVTVEIAAREVVCERTRWESTATVRLRYAAVNLSHAVLSAPVAVIAHTSPFTSPFAGPVGEDLITGADTVRVTSVQGVDASHLVLTDTDLTDCLFSGAFHLDQIRLEGRTAFAVAPTGWQRRGLWPVHWTHRRTVAEEHHWRARTVGQPALPAGLAPSPRQWRCGPHHPDPGLTPDPVDIAALYRQLRKALEDGKNEPGAADFYYGECEMRRHDLITPKSERRLLWGYWLLSGYGLRASRAAGWLLAAMSLTVLLLMGFGLPIHDPDPATIGTLHGSKISLNTTTPDPVLHGGWTKRITGARAEKATRVAVNSVVFRSSGQDLTTAGIYIEMTSRLLEPTLLALAALAVRGRIKR